MDTPPTSDVTRLLAELSVGHRDALAPLLPLVYDELRRLADRALGRERPGHTLQPTALAHEAYLRLVAQRAPRWQHRAHFLAMAAQIMRRILVDHARARHAAKRAGQRARLTLTGLAAYTPERSVDLEALDEALARLAALDERQSRIVEFRFFGGLSIDETAEVLGISPATVKREWTMAKAWLRRALADAPSGQPPADGAR